MRLDRWRSLVEILQLRINATPLTLTKSDGYRYRTLDRRGAVAGAARRGARYAASWHGLRLALAYILRG